MHLLKLTATVLVAAMATVDATATGANAQQLSNGDYELCAVYDADEDFVGYDSVCLERKRAQLRRYQRQSANNAASSGYSGAYYCPSYANGGHGYTGTVYSDGRVSTDYYGTYDRPVDGVRCLPRPNYYGTGYY